MDHQSSKHDREILNNNLENVQVSIFAYSNITTNVLVIDELINLYPL